MHLFAQSPNNVVDEVIWVVGDEAILRSDVEAARMDFGANISGNPYCVIPEQLAIQKLFLHQHSWTVWKSRTPRFPPTWRHV